jgi:hypothetical protein
MLNKQTNTRTIDESDEMRVSHTNSLLEKFRGRLILEITLRVRSVRDEDSIENSVLFSDRRASSNNGELIDNYPGT